MISKTRSPKSIVELKNEWGPLFRDLLNCKGKVWTISGVIEEVLKTTDRPCWVEVKVKILGKWRKTYISLEDLIRRSSDPQIGERVSDVIERAREFLAEAETWMKIFRKRENPTPEAQSHAHDLLKLQAEIKRELDLLHRRLREALRNGYMLLHKRQETTAAEMIDSRVLRSFIKTVRGLQLLST